MSELPEVQIIASGLKKKVLSRAFIDVWTDTKKLVKKPNFKNDRPFFTRKLAKKKRKMDFIS